MLLLLLLVRSVGGACVCVWCLVCVCGVFGVCVVFVCARVRAYMRVCAYASARAVDYSLCMRVSLAR